MRAVARGDSIGRPRFATTDGGLNKPSQNLQKLQLPARSSLSHRYFGRPRLKRFAKPGTFRDLARQEPCRVGPPSLEFGRSRIQNLVTGCFSSPTTLPRLGRVLSSGLKGIADCGFGIPD
jgi:hypothetical protein